VIYTYFLHENNKSHAVYKFLEISGLDEEQPEAANRNACHSKTKIVNSRAVSNKIYHSVFKNSV